MRWRWEWGTMAAVKWQRPPWSVGSWLVFCFFLHRNTKLLYQEIGGNKTSCQTMRQWPWSANIGAVSLAASRQNWPISRVHQERRLWQRDVWWRRWQRSRKRRSRRRFIQQEWPRIDQSWWSLLSYGRQGAPLPVQKHATISQHASWQVYIVKTRTYYCYYYFYDHFGHDT